MELKNGNGSRGVRKGGLGISRPGFYSGQVRYCWGNSNACMCGMRGVVKTALILLGFVEREMGKDGVNLSAGLNSIDGVYSIKNVLRWVLW